MAMRIVANLPNKLPGEDDDRTCLVRSELGRVELKLRSRLYSYKSVVEGHESYWLGGNAIKLRKGEAFLAPAREDIEVRVEDGAIGDCLYFQGRDLATHLGGASHGELSETLGGVSDLCGFRIPSVAGVPKAVEGALDHSDLEVFLSHLAERLARASGVYRKLDLDRGASARELVVRLETARDFILDNLGVGLTLDQIAKEACLSRFHLSRHFAAAYGAPPMRFHQAHRLKIARDRLRAGESVTSIANGLGFSEIASFSRAYKRVFGAAPSLEKSNFGQSH